MRTFTTGATRDDDANKIDYDGFISPYALKAFGEYMHRHRVQADGSLRDSDNWQKGIPMDAYRKSLWRHFHEAWTLLREGYVGAGTIEALCAMQFNVQGLLHELTKPGSPTEEGGLNSEVEVIEADTSDILDAIMPRCAVPCPDIPSSEIYSCRLLKGHDGGHACGCVQDCIVRWDHSGVFILGDK